MGKVFETSWHSGTVTALFAIAFLALVSGSRNEANACGNGMDDFACRPGQAYVAPVKPPPPPPPEPVYTGEWVHYFNGTGSLVSIPYWPGTVVRYNASKTCVSGQCNPNLSVVDNCYVDVPFLQNYYSGSSCPGRVLNLNGISNLRNYPE